ncbi:hypothetical protein SSBR45G_37990 [Bradyrhizobium sp. SSBR45G]|nr:hypothetical protein SSBR45G_37990 [Bradyrhizobium sp. SSBR45G]GLH86396.1 hypothetical protein SSBR45R_38560 [Bradyrhizobium sp. SSBR45R]
MGKGAPSGFRNEDKLPRRAHHPLTAARRGGHGALDTVLISTPCRAFAHPPAAGYAACLSRSGKSAFSPAFIALGRLIRLTSV